MMPTDDENKESGKFTSILTRVLRWVSSDEYEDWGNYMLFGTTYEGIRSTVFEEMARSPLPQATSDPEDAAWLQDVCKAAEIVKRYSSRLRVDRRTTLNKEADLEKLAQEARLSESGRAFLESLPIEKVQQIRSGPHSEGLIEEHFASEMVAKLPKVVKRALSWDELAPEEIQRDLPRDDVKKYWEEAHRCYLYGFPVACAVLCRAILESALVQQIDPSSAIKQQTSREESYFGRLIEEAEKRNVLTDDRPRCAFEVRDAGNEAIHNYEEFKRRLLDPRAVANILDSTRKILIDLYWREA
jgi:hypothetical protein